MGIKISLVRDSRQIRTSVLCATALTALRALALAGTPPPIQSEILFVTDPDLDHVYQCRDYNHDGNYNSVGETTVLYDDLIGTIALDEPICITADPDDTLFVGDTGRHFIVAINDRDGDGDANDAGEHVVYFDGDPNSPSFNGSGIVMLNPRSVALRFLNRLWVANGKTGAGDHSSILLLEDHNSDGDANDAGEAVEYWVPLPAGALGDFSPEHVEVGIDGHVYVLEDGTTGVRPRGITKLVDTNGSGTIDLAGEATSFFVLPAQPNTPQLTSFDQDGTGAWCVLDRGNRNVLRLADVNGSGQIENGTELVVFWSYGATRDPWDIAVSNANKDVYSGNTTLPDRLLRASDIDLNGSIQVLTEEFETYSDLIQTVNIDFPRGFALDFHGHEGVGMNFCAGDNGLCPCGNPGTSETGCANSTGLGAGLEASGTDGVVNDDLVFASYQTRPGALAILFQGSLPANGGVGVPFGDGLLCADGAIIRLGRRNADALGLCSWGPGLAAQGLWSVGSTRYFQVRYRNNGGPCGTGFNHTNGLMVTFTQ